jgi:nonsense-mediated mRNA decay protein 3
VTRDREAYSVFCVECGKDVEGDEELRGGICVDCFLERNPAMVLPEVVDLVRCPTCGSSQGRGGWSAPTQAEGDPEEVVQQDVADAAEAAVEVLEDALVRSMDVTVRREARSAYSVHIDAKVAFMGQVVDAGGTVRVRVRGELCPVCSRRAGQYYEALIQFRGTADRPATEPELERARDFVLTELERLSSTSRDVYLVKEERMHGGLDFYISTQPAAAQIARGLTGLFSATSTSSTKLTGRKDGKDVVRVTHAVRLPELRRGDYVLLKGLLYRVLSASAKEATVDPASGEGKRRHLSRGERQELELVGDANSPEEAVVVSTSEGEVQVLDPSSMRTVDLPVPEGLVLEGRETVRVVRGGDQLYITD